MKIREIHLVYAVITLAIFKLALWGFATLSERLLLSHEGNTAVAAEGLAIVPENTSAGVAVAQAARVPEKPKVAPKPVVQKPLPPAHPEYPGRLSIPSIEVDAAVQAVGLAKSGNIAAPSSFSAAGWYVKSALPGKTGSMIVDGHVDNGLLRLGVFKMLDQVKEGADVYIKTRGGKSVHYVVTSIQMYPHTDVPMADIVSQTDAARLVLITCAGSWIRDEKTYDKRLIVTAELVE